MQRPASSKDLSKYLSREVIKVVVCTNVGTVTVEELTLEYLDKSDRVRLQIDALRDILGMQFRMEAYPPHLRRPHLALWRNDTTLVVAQKHPQGGYQPMLDAAVQQVLDELQQQMQAFFPRQS